MEFKSFFKTVGGNEGNKCHYPTRLDTYGCGCQHDCKYCYAKSLLDFRKLWNAAQPAIVNIQKVHRTIKRNLKAGDIVRLGGMTDCFQPLERTARATYPSAAFSPIAATTSFPFSRSAIPIPILRTLNHPIPSRPRLTPRRLRSPRKWALTSLSPPTPTATVSALPRLIRRAKWCL